MNKLYVKPTVRGCQKKIKKCEICGKLLNWKLNNSGLCQYHLRESIRKYGTTNK